MRGKKRNKEERNELFSVLEGYLAMGFSLKKACSLADLPYSSVRDIVASYEPLRAKTRALQNSVNVVARTNLIRSIEKGNVADSKWWLERFDHAEPQESVIYGGLKEGCMTLAEEKEEVPEEHAADFKKFLFAES